MMIEHTKTEVESKYTVENGYEHDAKVRYTLPSLSYSRGVYFFPMLHVLGFYLLIWGSNVDYS